MAALTYDACQLLLRAIQSAGKPDRRAVRNALATTASHEGVTGTMRFEEGSGDPVKSAVILQVKGGKFVWVTNASP